MKYKLYILAVTIGVIIFNAIGVWYAYYFNFYLGTAYISFLVAYIFILVKGNYNS